MVKVIHNWIALLPVSRGGGIVVEESEHVQLEGVVLLPDNGDGKIDQNIMARIEAIFRSGHLYILCSLPTNYPLGAFCGMKSIRK